MTGRLTVVEGDLCEQAVDAIVNAANSELVLGSGVAGAIAKRGGPSIQAECTAHGAIAVGEAAITGAGDLPARFVIHAAGMAPGGAASEESVRQSARASFALALERGCATLAVPAVGAGVGGLSPQVCAETLVAEARTHLALERSLEEIRFVLFGEPMYRLFESAVDALKVQEQLARMKARKR